MWKNVFEGQWDILCAVEHKDHAKSGSFIQHNGYHVCYAHVNGGLYSGVILIVKDILQPVVVQSDIHGQYIVVDINYEGQRICIVGIYAPNEVAQRIALWQRLNEVLRNGNPGFLLGDFNMCSEMGQSTSMHSLMDARERAAWDLFAIEVLKCDAWLWINGTYSGYTFQSTQFRSTWSRLDRIYIMHDERFLP